MHRDMLGNRIFKGDIVAYPGRLSSSLWVNVGVVEDDKNMMVRKIKGNFGLTKYSKPRKLYRIDRVLIISHFDEKGIKSRLLKAARNG